MELNLKEKAQDFLIKVGLGSVQEGYTLYVAPNFIHHNPHFKGDRQSLLNAMQEAHDQDPNEAIKIKHCYQDGDTVITHSLVTKEAMKIAVMHVFKFNSSGMIEELWDVGHPIAPDTPNKNGLF